MKTVPLEELSLAVFSPLLNSKFRISLDPANLLEVKLTEASAHRSAAQAAALDTSCHIENFSLVFGGPADRFLPQGMYIFQHDQIGSFLLFIVPIGKDSDGFQYEAVFNRSAKTT